MEKIDKKKIYKSGDFSYRNFTTLDKATLETILAWRNHEEIRKWMYNQDLISLEDHFRFVNGLSQRDDMYYWLVMNDDEPIGVVNLVDIDLECGEAELGFYLKPELLQSGLGLEFTLYADNFAFNVLGVDCLNGGVLKENNNAVKLSKYLGTDFVSTKILNGSIFYTTKFYKSRFNENLDQKLKLRNFIKYLKNN